MWRARVRAHNARVKYVWEKYAGKRQFATASGLRYANLAFERAKNRRFARLREGAQMQVAAVAKTRNFVQKPHIKLPNFARFVINCT